MSHWGLVVGERGDDGAPVFKEVRRLSGEEFERLSAANHLFRRILGQTTWSVVQHNYSCFVLLERQLMEDLASHSTAPIDPNAYQVPITASVLNFLAAMRMFLDQSECELKRLDKADNGNRYDTWKSACSSEYDDYFAYRFLYRFRNYVQHVGLPLSIWDISISLAQSEELLRRAFSGEALPDDLGGIDAKVITILLGESPTDLVSNFDSWSTVKADLESLTTEIDLSEQIHVIFECLTRIAQAFQEQFTGELSVGVNAFTEIVGDLADYTSRPQLAKIRRDPPLIKMELMELEVERFLHAERLVTGATS